MPDRAPDDYVEGLFDAVADDFEPHVAGLHYLANQLVADRVREFGQPSAHSTSQTSGAARDLAGDLLRPWARTLVGCDLSVGMLRRAQRRGCYDVLHKAELRPFARAQPDAYDLVVSVDTLCYVGGLGQVATAVARALRPGGVVVATVERLGDSAPEPWRLTSSGRYAHRQDHLRDVSADVGLADVMVTPVHLRLRRASRSRDCSGPHDGRVRPRPYGQGRGRVGGRHGRVCGEGWAGRGGLTRSNACG